MGHKVRSYSLGIFINPMVSIYLYMHCRDVKFISTKMIILTFIYEDFELQIRSFMLCLRITMHQLH